ncbi:serine threonine protein kinase [Plasmopara halstedii]|uniref:Serine threonine protein kinase n=1 Tax=Plasmopara halstedii TaxID=4781 RepID=A0A0P1AW36_PLAHL|nr:serine threonine protein kinase [Plasmopara halstedii]CEG45666.1 serine threonine protein kinase [Plasmopara halstedii]|eukprot:XP_024582035.1 serine threonine protein kinase [Plasmopara halstedii]
MPPTTSRRRTRSVVRLDIEQRKRSRNEKLKMASIAALPVPERPPQFGNGVWVNDRYMRRKNREYLHAVHAAQVALASEEMPEETQKQTAREKVEEEDKEELESDKIEKSKGDHNDCALKKTKNLEQDTLEERKLEKMESILFETEKSRVSPRLKSPERDLVEKYAVFKAKEIVELENTSGAEVSLKERSQESSVMSPLETIGQKLHETSGIDLTPEKNTPPVLSANIPIKSVVRGIAQSSSSASNRKRMISFSPERAPRPENRALALKKLEKNLKTNEKLQQRLQAPTPVKRPASAQMTSPVSATQIRQPFSFTSPQPRRPMTLTSPETKKTMSFTIPNKLLASPLHQDPVVQSPYSAASNSLRSSQTEELNYNPTQEKQEITNDLSSKTEHADVGSKSSVVIKKSHSIDDQDDCYHIIHDDGEVIMQSQDDVGLSQESLSIVNSHVDPLSQESNNMSPLDEATATAAQADTTLRAFTSTSVIGDVGLFNCEVDVEYTGGVYGEGTDGKVTAAVINGQKIALKRAKPYEGIPEHEAKHRAALELHYLRRVRHMKGFLQCLGLCDAIEHTCIALEVMDCKLSDYLRRYGVNLGGSKHRRYTLSFDDTKAMLKQICLPMITLHEDINVAHGDLACRNILMRTPPEGYEKSWEPDIKLSDFGRIKLPSDEPKILDSSFSFHKNCDVGAFGREILYRLLVGEIVPKEFIEMRSLHKLLQDVTVTNVSDAAKARLGPYYNLFMRCTAWGVRPTFREIHEHLDDLEYFETTENGLFPLKPAASSDPSFMSPVAEVTRHKTPTSSASRVQKRDTSTGQSYRSTGSKSRLFASKTYNDASVLNPNKPVNWLKTRSVGAQRPTSQQPLTPTAHSLLAKNKKTPPSAGASAGTGASRRSLQILNQIQHRTNEKGRKSN